MRYMVFVIDNSSHSASGDEMAGIDAFNESLRSQGSWVMAAGIAAPAAARVIDSRAGRHLVSSGSLFDATEHYSGFWIIDMPDDEAAVAAASDASRACNRRVELRPFL